MSGMDTVGERKSRKDKKEKWGCHEPASRARLRPGALRAALRGWLARDAGGTSEKL
ncbi:hypothetical protein GCM10007867_29290 [Gluconobacter cerinus]|uniref:Uncharacterized protein n=1 Tax=Gluconobacter cerinus TaxID=38307 RepID=A0AAV5NJU2_9PROT|nr:hypothetical protein GCM10007867_29290 [Gluconobacter cerinus]